MKNIYFTLIVLGSFFSTKTLAQCSTPATIPYYESFQSITNMNQLPSCWASSNPSTCGTSTGSTGFAFFYYQAAATSYFYSNAIQLSAGIVYSVSVFYTAGFNPTATWSDLSLLLNQSQSAIGASTLVSTNGFAMASVMTNLSNTFTVANSGVYYIAVKGTSNGTGSSQYLSWDDLSITIPCQISPNSPNLNVVPSATAICPGDIITFTASGANTYTWSTNAFTSVISESPLFTTTYSVSGTNSLTGCITSTQSVIKVHNPVQFTTLVSHAEICLGNSASINFSGGGSTYSYQINGIPSGSTNIVTPTVSSYYNVVATASTGCSSFNGFFIDVKPLPIINIYTNNTNVCAGDSVSLFASGASTYQWLGINSGYSVSVFPLVNTVYVVTGTDIIGCVNTSTIELKVSSCTGINSFGASKSDISLSPNPFQNEFLISTGSYDLKTIVISDINGRVILDVITREEQLLVNTRYYAQGIYYVKILSGEKNLVLKMIKN